MGGLLALYLVCRHALGGDCPLNVVMMGGT